MTDIYFEDLNVGDTFKSPGRTVTQADVVAFAGGKIPLAIRGEEPSAAERNVARFTATMPDPCDGRLSGIVGLFDHQAGKDCGFLTVGLGLDLDSVEVVDLSDRSSIAVGP